MLQNTNIAKILWFRIAELLQDSLDHRIFPAIVNQICYSELAISHPIESVVQLNDGTTLEMT